MPDTSNTLSSHLLVKSVNGKFQIISLEQVIHRKDRQKKLKVGDEVSWNAKNRSERGRGKIIEIGKFNEKSSNLMLLFYVHEALGFFL